MRLSRNNYEIKKSTFIVLNNQTNCQVVVSGCLNYYWHGAAGTPAIVGGVNRYFVAEEGSVRNPV